MATTVTGGRWIMAQHHALVDEAVWKLIHRKIPQRILMVREPPRHGKSEHLSHWTPAWYLLNFPGKEVIVTGHSDTFAQKWGRRSRNTFVSLAALFGTALATDRQAASSWGTTQGGGCITAGIGGGIGGEGASLLIVDDLIKNHVKAQSEAYREECWDWFRSTAWTRLAPNGVCVLIGTSWHRDDYQQRVKREFGDAVLDICLPATAEENDLLGREPGVGLWLDQWPQEWYEEQKIFEGPYNWSALYQQRPSLHEHAEWPAEYFEDHIWAENWYGPFELSAVWIDPSKGKDQKRGDYAAVVFVGLKSRRLWVDAWIDRRPIDQIVAQTIARSDEWEPHATGLEGNGFQDLITLEFDKQCAELRRPPISIHVDDNMIKKEYRIGVCLGPHLARKQIVFRDNKYTRLLVEQLKDFPLGDHDDGPDALEGAIKLLGRIAGGPQQDYVEDFVGANG